MAVFTLNLPDAQLPRLVAAVALQTGQDASAMNAAQKAAMVKAAITSYLITVVQASEIPGVQAAAGATRAADIVANIQIT